MGQKQLKMTSPGFRNHFSTFIFWYKTKKSFSKLITKHGLCKNTKKDLKTPLFSSLLPLPFLFFSLLSESVQIVRWGIGPSPGFWRKGPWARWQDLNRCLWSARCWVPVDPKHQGPAWGHVHWGRCCPEVPWWAPRFTPAIPRQKQKGRIQELFWCQAGQNWVTEWTGMLTAYYGKRKPEADGLHVWL